MPRGPGPVGLIAEFPSRPVLLWLLLCALAGLVSAGCGDDRAWSVMRTLSALTEHRQMQREQSARNETTARLAAAYRACLATGGSDADCGRHLLAYLSCLHAGANDAQCRTELPE